jgi:N-acetylmuramic acid 6-phosphate etherase
MIASLRTLDTEQPNPKSSTLDRMPVGELLATINREDATVARAVRAALPQIERVVKAVVKKVKKGGRLFYIGAGTSGRLGVLDASEMPPTYGVPPTWVQGLIAGGFPALTASQEGAEDDGDAGVKDIRSKKIGKNDAVIGLSVSGRAKYVREALHEANRRGAFTGCITCNRASLLIPCAEEAIVVETGPEVVAGSTRMKAGTAQKMVLNMISTALMVRMGRVKGNRMVDLQIKCEKLKERACHLLMDQTGCGEAAALKALTRAKGSVRKAATFLKAGA